LKRILPSDAKPFPKSESPHGEGIFTAEVAEELERVAEGLELSLSANLCVLRACAVKSAFTVFVS